MNKIYSSKFMSFMFVLLVVIQIIMTILLIFGILNSENKSVFLIIYIFMTVFCFLGLFYFNRTGCIIYYDQTKQLVTRRGFIFGYKYTLKVSDIKDIVVATLPINDEYFVFIDGVKTKFEFGFKNSCIIIEKNEYSINFIRQFYDLNLK